LISIGFTFGQVIARNHKGVLLCLDIVALKGSFILKIGLYIARETIPFYLVACYLIQPLGTKIFP